MAVFLLYRVVKLTSPLINYFLIVGSYMMFFSIYIRVLPYTGESVNTYRCNVSLTSVRNSYVRYCYPTDSTMDEHDCILLWIWHHPHKDGKVYKIFHNPSTKKNRIVSITPFSTIDVFSTCTKIKCFLYALYRVSHHLTLFSTCT